MHITNWLSGQNHAENKDDEIAYMKLSIYTISTTTNMPAWMTIQHIWVAVLNNTHFQDLTACHRRLGSYYQNI